MLVSGANDFPSLPGADQKRWDRRENRLEPKTPDVDPCTRMEGEPYHNASTVNSTPVSHQPLERHGL